MHFYLTTYNTDRHLDCEWITKNELSDAIATDLKKRGFKYLGSTHIYSFLQSIGMINGHSTGCWIFEKIGGIFIKWAKSSNLYPKSAHSTTIFVMKNQEHVW